MGKTTDSTSFNTAYDTLNAAQKKAVDTIEGPVMVIAGPGTGKTQILTLRIANILQQTDASPDSILALTFTESGAKAMRERLVRYIGSTAYRVTITTFHAFAGGLIGRYPDAYPNVVGGQSATDLDRIKIIEDILESGKVDTLRPAGNPQYYVRPLLSMISDLKREYISPDRLGGLIGGQEAELQAIEQFHTKGAHKGKERGEYKEAVKVIAKNRSLAVVYRLYEAELRSKQLYDFDDMIVETVHALEQNQDMLSDLQEQYQYLLADEHQDVNGAQNKILELLANYHDRPNIFVVGDEKQAIFRFQGASLENFLHFESRFKDTAVISLTENYRSGPAILDAAHSLISVGEGPLSELRAPLSAAVVQNATVSVRDFEHQAVEDHFLIEQVQTEIKNGVPASEIAVIVRSNREVEDLATQLRIAGVPATASAESDILNHAITRQVEALLQAAATTNERALFEQLHAPYWGLLPADVLTICSSQKYKQGLYTIVTSPELLAEIGVSNIDAVHHVVTTLAEAKKRSLVEAPHSVLAWLLEESGLKQMLLEEAPHDSARVVRRLYDEIEGLVRRNESLSISDVLQAFAQRRSYGLALSAPFVSLETEAVQVMTAHKSKGLEFSVVFAPHLIDSMWGGKRQRNLFKIPKNTPDSPDETDDEKRLLYVLMTRAKERLYLMSSEQNADGRPLTPSRLLAELDESALEVVSIVDSSKGFNPLTGVAATKSPAMIDPQAAAALFSERGFSATSLNNYLRSPYDYYFKNLLRIPEVQPTHMLYGTAVHEVLRRVAQETVKNSFPKDQQVIDWLEHSLQKLPLAAIEYSRLHEKSIETVLPYVAKTMNTLPTKIETEFSMSVLFDTGIPELPVIPLKGNLDRIDFDDSGKVIRVVDYKTGKPKSRNFIEGNTQGSDGAYKRQLVFYALLMELYNDERFQCRTGKLSFVESATGTLKEETFDITDEEVVSLKQEIITAATELVNESWITQTCDPATSDYCYLV